MTNKDTIIVVGVTREDEYGNLWVTPQGGGDEVKIAGKRSQLHPLFEQGKAVMLHWETYKGKAYVSDAKLVEGVLPEPQPSDKLTPEHKDVIREVVKPAPQELGMWWKELGEMIRAGDTYALKFKEQYFAQMFSVLPLKEVDNESKTQNPKMLIPDVQPKTDEAVVEVSEVSTNIKSAHELIARMQALDKKCNQGWIMYHLNKDMTEDCKIKLLDELEDFNKAFGLLKSKLTIK